MNIKTMLMSALAGASMLAALVGTGSAAQTLEINVYGASAQYLYWNAAAPGILGTAPGGQGCTTIQQATKDSKNAITKATGCPGGDTIIYRVSSKASYDGPSALLGDDHYAAVGAAAEKCSAGDPGDPGAALRGYYRKMVDENSCTTWGTAAAPASAGCSALKCVRVTLGVSDVAGSSFTQSSSGQLKGPASGGAVSRAFSGIAIPASFNGHKPVVVPFAFFAHNSVKKCNDATPTEYASCSAGGKQTITNLPRMMAVQIFSGQSWYWSDFGTDFVSLPIVACLRHAGSGTHSALDYAVMNQKWGAKTATAQSAAEPTVWFNDGAADEMNCVNTLSGAIGYADADQPTTPTYANTVRLMYNGETPARVNIRNGRYDFWTNEWAYEDTLAPLYSTTHPHVATMMTYAADPAHIPGASTPAIWGTDKSLYWAAAAEMVYDKDTDQNYPGFVGADIPMAP